jgi:hypothetical protein
MSNVPKSSATDDVAEQLADLSEEFPGWTIKLTDQSFAPFQAVRHGGGTTLGAGSYAGLRMLLHDADAADCGRALHALRDALRVRGADAYLSAVSIATRTRTGVARTIGAHRGVFSWDRDEVIGPIGEVDKAADEIVRALGLEPPQ